MKNLDEYTYSRRTDECIVIDQYTRIYHRNTIDIQTDEYDTDEYHNQKKMMEKQTNVTETSMKIIDKYNRQTDEYSKQTNGQTIENFDYYIATKLR